MNRPRKPAATSARSKSANSARPESTATVGPEVSKGERKAAKRAPVPETPAQPEERGSAAAPAIPHVFARVPMDVRWGDLDAFNHVNNATFLVYAQEARLAWLANVKGSWFNEAMMPVVAAAQMNFRRQLAWPARIAVELAATRIGTSSLTIAHRIVDASNTDCVYADGDVVMVWIDPASGRSVPLPASIREACEATTT